MSHFTKVATKINSIASLLKVLQKMGLKYTHAEQGVEVRGYKGQKITAEVSINMGKYDIGVVKNENGNYEFVADWWGVETTQGTTEEEFVETVNKEYAYVRVVEACEQQGYQISQDDIQVAEDGTVKLTATKWG
jgi:hypothetical protein